MTTFLIILFGALFIWWAARYKPESKRGHVAEARPQEHASIDQATPSNLSGERFTVTVTPSGSEPDEQTIDMDAWLNEPSAYYMGKERKLNGVNLHIHFVDREGKATERDITTLRYAHNPETHGGSIYAFCHLRQANRPFAFSRIKKAVDLETGELIADLGVFLDAAYRATPVGVVDKFLDEHAAGMFVLFSFAKADGAMRAKERTIMLDWARSHGLTDEAALAQLEEQMKKVWYATDHAFWDAVKTVKKEGRDADYMQSIWQAVRAILNSDKKLGDLEEQYLKYAARQWGFKVPELTASPQVKTKA